MKVDELLKRLENIKIDEDEKHEIAEYLARKFSVDKSLYVYFIITKDRKIYEFVSYKKLLESGEISSNDAYVYVENTYFIGYDSARYLYPFLKYGSKESLVNAYLSKLGFRSSYVIPAPGLRYIAIVVRILNVGRMSVEVADIGTVAINMKLPTLIRDILGTKYIDDYDISDIASQLDSQKLFAGYDSNEARDIIRRYYESHDTSLAKEVGAIKDAYSRIFKPYRVVYDLKTKQFQVSDNNEDRGVT
jgi:hypothetical protein